MLQSLGIITYKMFLSNRARFELLSLVVFTFIVSAYHVSVPGIIVSDVMYSKWALYIISITLWQIYEYYYLNNCVI